MPAPVDRVLKIRSPRRTGVPARSAAGGGGLGSGISPVVGVGAVTRGLSQSAGLRLNTDRAGRDLEVGRAQPGSGSRRTRVRGVTEW